MNKIIFLLLAILTTSCGKTNTEETIEYRNCKDFRSKWTQRNTQLTLDLTNMDDFEEVIPISLLSSLDDEAVVCTYNLLFTPIGNEFQGDMTVSYRPVSRGWSGNLSAAEVSYCKTAEATVTFELKCTNLVTCSKQDPSDCKTYE